VRSQGAQPQPLIPSREINSKEKGKKLFSRWLSGRRSETLPWFGFMLQIRISEILPILSTKIVSMGKAQSLTPKIYGRYSGWIGFHLPLRNLGQWVCPNPSTEIHIQRKGTQEPCYRRQDRAMPLYISIRIKFYNHILRFLCHSTHFLLVFDFVCRLQWIIYRKVTSTRKNQSDRIVNADK